MFRSFLLFLAGVAAAIWAGSTIAQSAADDCIQQGFRPGSAAYHACISDSESQGFGMFDPLDDSSSEVPGNPGEPGGTPATGDSANTWIQQLDRLGSDTAADDPALSGWNWSAPAK